MSVLVTGNDEAFAAWAGRQMPHVGRAGFGPCKTLAVATGTDAQDELLAVVVYHDYDDMAGTVQVSIAARSPKWATRGNIRAILGVAFEQYGCRKVWSVMPSTNLRALRLNKGLGFKIEGTLRHQFAPKVHAVVTGMMDYEYKRLWCESKRTASVHLVKANDATSSYPAYAA